MKNKLLKILSSLLILSFLVTALSVFSFAEESTGAEGGSSEGNTTEENTDNLTVFVNRNYEEGWDYTNGFSYRSIGTNNVYIDYDEDTLGYYNYFVRYEAAGTSATQTRINFGTETVTNSTRNTVLGTVIEFSIKADDLAQLGNIMWATTGVGRKTISLLDINKNGDLIAFNGVSDGSLNLGTLGNEWINIAYIFDWQQENLCCTIKLGYGLGNGYSESHKLEMFYEWPGDVGLYYLYFGIPAYSGRSQSVASESYGMSWCLDNLKVYQGVRSTVEIEEGVYGSVVNSLADKTIDIQESAGVKSKAQLLEEALAMKVGVDYALIKNARYALLGNSDEKLYNGTYGAPVKQDDNVLIPLQLLLDYIGFPSYTHPDEMSFDITTGTSTTYITLGRDTATVDGERVTLTTAPGYLENSDGEKYLVIALEDVPTLFPGWLAIYDDMGLIIIYEDSTPEDLTDNAPIVTRSEDLSTMVDIMKKFVFDTVTDEEKELGYIANGTLVYDDVVENTKLAHPYLVADGKTFEDLASKYALKEGSEGYDATVKAYVQAIIDEADGYYNTYAKLSGGAYKGIKDDLVPVNVNSGDGYDTNGELAEIVEYASILPTLAFAYQMTGDAKYAKLAYDWTVALGEWSHWAPGYFKYCAESTYSVAISYDWLYNGYKKLGLDTDAIAEIIYSLGVHDGYVSSSGGICEHARSLGDKSGYITSQDSTNAICSSGMIVGALAILDYVSGANAPEGALNETLYLIGNNIQNLIQYGLDIYAPDGSYIESATYWEEATSALFRMIMSIDSAAGTDYGMMDTWGLDKTCYYAIYIESSDGFIWNYHDGGVDGVSNNVYLPEELASLNTDMFYFVGSYLGDDNLLAVRQYQLSNGKSATVYDLLFYPTEGIGNGTHELELDYYMSAVEAYVARSGWTEGAMYTGIMGGMNNVTYGQFDSGNFIYHNRGIVWIMDLGTENPYVSNYYVSGTRYKYYRVAAEGQNVILMTDEIDVAYGQYSAAGGIITKTYENEHGSYAILDNSPVYLNKVSYAKRGLLVTNDRETVVLQDELSFILVESMAWVVHTAANVKLTDDRRSAYLTQRDATGKTQTLRMTIVSQRPDFTFEICDVNKPLLSGTLTSDKISGASEYSRAGITRIAIRSTTISFDLAVVFEIIDDTLNEPSVAYNWTYMTDWMPSELKVEEVVTENVSTRGAADKTDIKTSTTSAESILKRDTAFTERLKNLYEALTTVEYTLNTYSPTSLDSTLASYYADYLDCVDEYEEFLEYVNGSNELVNNLVLSVVGIELEEEYEE